VKVIQISTNDIQGGAAKAAYRLHQALRQAGEESEMLVARKDSSDPFVHTYQPAASPTSRLRRIVRKEWIRRSNRASLRHRPEGFEHFRDDRTPFGREVLASIPGSDLANLHWVADFVDISHLFPWLPWQRPTVWTLHDMNPLTGGCHFDHGCGRFATRCGSCPQLGSDDEDDLAARVWLRKKRAFYDIPDHRLHLVAPSRWLADEAKRSSILKRFPVSVIPNGLDVEIFRPAPSTAVVRRALGIPEGARVILFLAEYVSNRRKGFAYLDEALHAVVDIPDLYLVSLGKNCPSTSARVPHLHLGSITHDPLLAAVYSMADLFVIPSLQDNLPNTVLESIACGTPVAGFDAGGISDMVRDGSTGYLAPVGDIRVLAEAIRRLLTDDAERARMGEFGRALALDHFSLQHQADRYRALYSQMLERAAEERHTHPPQPASLRPRVAKAQHASFIQGR
jgi:glycosyltransferase involved in cell wall biosynthesis